MRFSSITFIALLTLGLHASAQTSNEATSDSVLLPLAVGNTWTMETSSNEGGKTKERVVTFTVGEEVMLAGERGYRLGPKGDEALILGNGAGGLYLWDERDAKSHLLLPFPAKQGDLHSIGENSLGVEKARVMVVDTRAQVLVGGAMLTCYHYKVFSADKPSAELHVYMAPNVGMTKLEAIVPSDGADEEKVNTARAALVSYTLRGTPGSEPRSDVE